MEQLLDIGKRSLKTLWVNKYLWFFGFFAATVGGGGGSRRSGPGAAPGLSPAEVPTWLWILIGVGAVVGLAYFALHVLSEAALIEGVADGQRGERLGIRRGLRRSGRHFFRVLGLKLLVGLLAGGACGIIAAPILLAVLGLVPWWAGILFTVLLGLVGLPVLLTLYFLYEYALRFAVLEDHGALDALGHARRFLHGRIGLSVKLTLLSLAGQCGGWIALGVVMLPAAALAGVGYLLGGVIAAVVVGSILGLPLMVLAMGAVGTFRSSVWTLGFMDHHYAA